MLQRFDRGPRPRRRSPPPASAAAAGLIDDGAPVLDPGVLVPVGIVDQRIALAPGAVGLSPASVRSACAIAASTAAKAAASRASVSIDAERPSRSAASWSLVIVAPTSPVPSFRSPLPSFPVALPSPAAQARKTGGRQRPVRLGRGDAAPGAQHGMRPGQLVGRGADVHAGVVENEIFEVDQLAFAATGRPQASVKWVRATQPSRIGLLASRSSSRASASSAAASGPAIAGPGQRIGDLVAGLQGLDNLNGNRSNGS